MTSTPEPASRLSRTYISLQSPLPEESLRTWALPPHPSAHAYSTWPKAFLTLPRAPFLAWPASTPQPQCPLLHDALWFLSQQKSPFSSGSLLPVARPLLQSSRPLPSLWRPRLRGRNMRLKQPVQHSRHHVSFLSKELSMGKTEGLLSHPEASCTQVLPSGQEPLGLPPLLSNSPGPMQGRCWASV